MLCHIIYKPSSKSVLHQVTVPQALQECVLKLFQENPVAGHLSAENVLKDGQQICYCHFMACDIHK